MGDAPQKPRNPPAEAVRRLTPLSSRQAITEGAKELEVDDFIDNHLRERPRTVPEMALPAEAKPAVRTLALQAVPMKTPSAAPPAKGSEAPPKLASLPPTAEVPSVHPPGFIRPVEPVGEAPPSVRPSLRPRPLVSPVSQAPSGQRRLWLLVVGIMAVAVGASLAVIAIFRNRPAPAPKTEPSLQLPSTSTPAAMPSPSSKIASSAVLSAEPSAVASVAAEPSSASSALPSAAPSVPSASASPTPEVGSSAAASALLSFQGALTVVSSVDADVVLQGQTVGRTNQRLVVRCGPKNVRLRDATGKWLTPGEPARVACMQETKLTLQP